MAIVAEHLGLVGAWRLMLVCRAACAGAKVFLATLPRLVVCGGRTGSGGAVSDVRRLDLATLRWETMPSLLIAREDHACCTVRGALVVLGGDTSLGILGSVEMLAEGEGSFTGQPPLTCGGRGGAVAIGVNESGSAAGQVLLLGGYDEDLDPVSTVYLVDLASGICTPQPNLLSNRCHFTAARLPDGRIVCAEGLSDNAEVQWSAEVFGPPPPPRGALGAAWIWSDVPALSVVTARYGCRGCVLSDGRFAVLGGVNSMSESLSSCETLAVNDGEDWEPMSPMHEKRSQFACVAVAGCVIVAGGVGTKSAEIFDEVLDRWMRLPYDIPVDGELYAMGDTLL